MNHLFGNITWSNYFELLAFALVIYYLYVGLRWFRADIATLFRRGRLSAETASQGSSLPITGDLQGSEELCVQTEQGSHVLSEAEMLTMALLAAIAEISSQPYEPRATVQKLKAIICRYVELRNSKQRAAINSLVAAECKKTGIAQLSEQDVDMWWDG